MKESQACMYADEIHYGMRLCGGMYNMAPRLAVVDVQVTLGDFPHGTQSTEAWLARGENETGK